MNTDINILMYNLKVIYIYYAKEFNVFLEKIKKANILFIYFENNYQNLINTDDYLKSIIIYDNNNIYIVNINFIIDINKRHGIVLFKRFLDIINRHKNNKILFNIKQFDLLNNFIFKYNIRNADRKKKENFICLDLNTPISNKYIKRIDDYYKNIMFLLYNNYNGLYFKNPFLVLEYKKITYILLNNNKHNKNIK